eukprot:jgi/Chlat1/2002/Chrsp158S02318
MAAAAVGALVVGAGVRGIAAEGLSASGRRQGVQRVAAQERGAFWGCQQVVLGLHACGGSKSRRRRRRAGPAAVSAVLLENDVDASTSSSGNGATSNGNGSDVVTPPSRTSGRKAAGTKGASSVSSGIKLEKVSKTFKNAQVLKDVSWEVKKGERVGLVGVNGAGKTTQLKIIAGLMEPDDGEVIRANNRMQIAYLTQEFDVVPTRTVREEFMSAFAEQLAVQKEIEEVQVGIENATEDMDLLTQLLDRLDVLQRKAESVDLYSMDKFIDKMMPSLGFTSEDNDRLVASFSGGWQMRMSLGKILLQEPDLLLLDEPTNHLDLDAIEWLEGYLKGLEVPMVIVSHDREFLDQLCTKIVETELGVSTTYSGNYSEFVRQKQVNFEMQMAAYERQQKEIARQEEMIARLGAGANAGRATTAEKTLEKLAAEGQLVEKPFVPKQNRFRFPQTERSGRDVLRIEGLTQLYADKVLFQDAELLVERGERIAIIGPNGCGKSTLLRFIMGFEKPQDGKVELGMHQMKANYFEQNQAEALDLSKSVIGTIEDVAFDWSQRDIKGLLGRFLFKGDASHKKVEWLSGGEKARLALAKFMVTPANVMVLDEPTNHLDIPSKEMLEDALRNFDGTVIAVSHDRYFLKQIVTRVVEVKEGKLVDYEGDYGYYLEKNEDAAEREEVREAAKVEVEAKPKAKSKMLKSRLTRRKRQSSLGLGAQQRVRLPRTPSAGTDLLVSICTLAYLY